MRTPRGTGRTPCAVSLSFLTGTAASLPLPLSRRAVTVSPSHHACVSRRQAQISVSDHGRSQAGRSRLGCGGCQNWSGYTGYSYYLLHASESHTGEYAIKDFQGDKREGRGVRRETQRPERRTTRGFFRRPHKKKKSKQT